MCTVTEELVRRRAEHNDCELFSLEELSLHQQDLQKIQHLEHWCRELRILLLQNNLIPKIENVGRLKKLEYLNLALNNIEVIENLEGCESLQKLDLTLNFVGRLSSVGSLTQNIHLRELFLLGNPCAEFQGYRPYVATTLPQLQFLDGKEISRSERLQAAQGLEQLRADVHRQEQEYLRRREREKEEASEEPGDQERRPHIDGTQCDEEQADYDFWNSPCSNSPESRLAAHRHVEEKRKENQPAALKRSQTVSSFMVKI
uniref:Leucine-rich repeat-containing protein 6 n=1 Tax=Neogobius melanostomus TaxID=47308 RepID=A0A8C6UFX7_9GOBI